jgi:NADPH:quinone reductase-like Zn-dependent oxidoreductase
VSLAAEAEAAISTAAGHSVDSRSIVHDCRTTMSDPVFLITGASSGIGAATAREAARSGYRVVLAARSVDRLRELAQELGGDERALALSCDVTE